MRSTPFLKTGKRTLALISFSLMVAFAFSLILDRVLGVLGFSAHETIRVTYPPNYSELRESIGEFQYMFTTNSRGIRYPEIPLTPPAGERRVVVLGDSFVEGWGVEREKTFTALLEQAFSAESRKVRFINMGLTATGPVEYARALIHVGFSYNPDAVLVCLYANDISDTPEITGKTVLDPPEPKGWRKVSSSLWPQIYALFIKSIDRRNSESSSSQDWIISLADRARKRGISERRIAQWKKNIPVEWSTAVQRHQLNQALLAWGLMRPNYWVESLDIPNTRAERKWEIMSRTLDLMMKRSREKNIEVGMIFIPFNFQYDIRPFERKDREPWQLSGMKIRKEWLYSTSEFERRLELWAKEHSVPFLNLTPFFREKAKEEGNLNFPIDGHWTPEGHRLAATLIQNWLKKEKVLSWL